MQTLLNPAETTEHSHPPRRARLPRSRLLFAATTLALAAVGCGGGDSEEAATATSTTAAASSQEGFCSHVKPGEAQPPERMESGAVMFVFTDLDDDPQVRETINWYAGPTETAEDRVSPGQYCDGEQQMAECRIDDGREVHYEDKALGIDITSTGWLKLAGSSGGEEEWVTDIFIRDREEVISQLQECPQPN